MHGRQRFSSSIMGHTLTAGKISLNLLIRSITLPHISAFTNISGEFDYNRTSLAPPGTRFFIHNIPNDCELWSQNGEDGWYIVPAMGHYICHKSYISNTRAERISDTVEFPTHKFNMSQMSSMDATYHAAQYLIYALHNTSPSIPLVKLGNKKKE